ncbi:hypothetical protein BJV82DRAFT_609210 [Fennellomyces sp. T-0311]|nr:hypothetical protein BJV82DRAFT_609210 [Fennellomyces sp. T-0311]
MHIFGLFCYIATLCLLSSASPTNKQCRNYTEQESCRKSCESQVLQPVCIDQQCICTTIGDHDCTLDKSLACKAFCKEIKQTFVGCDKDECICNPTN